MKLEKLLLYIFYFTLLCVCILSLSTQAQGADEAITKKVIPGHTPLAVEILSWSNSLPKDLIDSKRQLGGLTSVDELQKELIKIENEIENLDSLLNTEQSHLHKNYHRLSSLDSNLGKLNSHLDSLYRIVESNLRLLGVSQSEYNEKQQYIQNMSKQAKKDFKLRSSSDILDSMETSVNKTTQLLEQKTHNNLLTGEQICKIRTKGYVLNNTVSDLIADRNRLNLSKTSHSMLSAKFYRRFNSTLFKQGWRDLHLFAEFQLNYIKQNLDGISISLAIMVLLSIALKLSKFPGKGSLRWTSFATKPFTSAIFVTCTSVAIANNSMQHIRLPPEWGDLLLLPLILSVSLLTKNVISTDWQASLVSRLALFLATIELFTIMELPHPLIHLLVLYISAADLLYYFYLFILRITTIRRLKITWAIWIWGLFPLVIIVAGITGYDHFAVFIFEVTLSTMVASLTVCLLFLMMSGFVETILLNFPIEFIRKNSKVIVGHIDPLLLFLCALMWSSIILIIFRVYPTLNAALNAIFSVQLNVYSLSLAPGSIMVVVTICYATLLVSRSLRAFLMQVVLPRYAVKSGTQISISRLAHYAIFTSGFFLLLKIFGWNLSHIAILGGALSVGIGFGLQDIANNFVSGLILLFERPIKVGDIIEMGEDFGEVKELGLRATIVQTYDDAEIVIPNSELLTSSVTNWTLAEKKARVKVPVHVAYGSDIEKVTETLVSCGKANPRVLVDPQPTALFLAFGASSLDFELHVWIDDFSNRISVLSELNTDLESRCISACIELPFPQTDLHLRSIDGKATDLFRGLVENKNNVDCLTLS